MNRGVFSFPERRPFERGFESDPIEIPATMPFSVSAAHGLGARPILWNVSFRCVTAEHDYSVDDEILWTHTDISDSTGSSRAQISIAADDTSVTVGWYNQRENVIRINNKTTGSLATLTKANWRLILRAYL